VKDDVRWRPEIDALVFPVENHAAFCAVHRRAFRTLLRSEPSPEHCLSYFDGFKYAFRAAAGVKIAQKLLPVGQNFHLTSRDITRKLVELEPKEQGEQRWHALRPPICPSPSAR
jgi:hypothetical protein